MASIIAVSLFGRGASHSAPSDAAASSRIGLMLQNSTPAALARVSQRLVVCSPTPPGVTCVLRVGTPPNITSKRVLSTMLCQLVPPLTKSELPTTCLTRMLPAALL